MSNKEDEVTFVSQIVSGITGHSDCFTIEKSVDERGVLLKLFVENEHLGRVIGKSGGTASSIRGLLRALGVRNNAHYSLIIRGKDETL